MVGTNMVLALLVSQVFLTCVPAQGVNIVSYLIPHPKILHSHGTQSLALDGVIANANCRCIIAMYRHLWLGVSHIR
jgi:hypothetical protein